MPPILIVLAVAAGGFFLWKRSQKTATTPGANGNVTPPLPPEPKPKPKPIAPTQVPSTVQDAAETTAPLIPVPSIPFEDWATYRWYTYKGNAPQKMWIRVDVRTTEGLVLVSPNTRISGDVDFNLDGGNWRWVVIMGKDTPMATEKIEFGELVVKCEACEGVVPIAALARAEYDQFLQARILPVAGELVAEQAAKWIDLAFGG